MELGELITALQAEDPAKVCPYGFTSPHSWRGDYYDLAFSPARNVTVGSMLAAALSAVGATYQGWKGGDYTMNVDSDCYLAEPRDLGETLGPTLLRLMLDAGSVPAPPAEPTSRLREALTTAREALDLGRGCPDYSDHGPSEEWHCEGCLEAKAVEEAIAAIDAALADTPAPPAELTEAQRCPSCDHLTEGHTAAGCWYAIDDHSPSVDGICPCTRVHKLTTTPEQDGEQAEGGR